MTKHASLNSIFFVSATLVALSGATPAKADANAPFFWQNRGDGSSTECNYYTLAQCQAASRGTGGWCIANPSFALARQRNRAAR